MIDLAPNNAYTLTLASPVIAAAGCLGYGVEYARSVNLADFGAIVTRTTTLGPRRVSRPPRLVETPAGLLCVGIWPNPGLDAVLKRYAPEWARWSTPVILSIGGETVGDYGQIVEATEGIEGIAGFEVVLPGDLGRAAAAVQAVRRSTLLPVLVKLPQLESEVLATLAQAVTAAGADALTLFAPPPGLHVDTANGERLEGWLSGPAIRPLAQQRLAEVAADISVPIVACGGIAGAEDVRQFLEIGATAVQIGSALLVNPFVASEIALTRAVG